MKRETHPKEDLKAVASTHDFLDYRAFLAERHRALKAVDPKVSHRYINLRVGVRSAGWFADVLAGRQRLKPRHIAPLSSALKLDAREKELLRIFVDMEGAATPEERNSAYERWLGFKGIVQEHLEEDRFKYFERWYLPALRELLLLTGLEGLKGSKDDYTALAAQLDPPITPRQARDAVQLLARLGLLNPAAPEPAPTLVKRPGKTSHWGKILKAYTELALPAMQKHGKDARDLSGLTLALSPEGLKQAGEEIAALRRRLLALSARDAEKNRVYQCLFQVFPLSQPVEDSHA